MFMKSGRFSCQSWKDDKTSSELIYHYLYERVKSVFYSTLKQLDLHGRSNGNFNETAHLYTILSLRSISECFMLGASSRGPALSREEWPDAESRNLSEHGNWWLEEERGLIPV